MVGQSRCKRLFATLASFGFVGILVSAEPAMRAKEAEATQIQFWIVSDGDGWACQDCCFTGFCCSVPIDGCGIQEH